MSQLDEVEQYRSPESTHVGKVRLAVSNLERSLAFYSTAIGLRVLTKTDSPTKLAQLGALGSDNVLLELEQLPGLQPLGRQTRLGLYHFAVLLPSRGDLANFITHATQNRIEFGSSDHLFSEATYLVDPDGLTVEVYADRPRSEWVRDGSQLVGAIDPLDFAAVLATGDGNWQGAPLGTTIGHMHFYVGDLATASAFYADGLGFDIMTRLPGALFVSAGGYHHHAGLNTWAARSPIAASHDPRLLFWELVLPSIDDVVSLSNNLKTHGFKQVGNTAFVDPWGIQVQFVAELA